MFNKTYAEFLREHTRGLGRVGLAMSSWDLLHAGHCLFLKFAREHCDHLICGLHHDPKVDREWKNSPIQSIEERRILISSNRYVDDIIEYETEEDHLELIKILKPHVRFFGSDYLKLETFTGKDLEIPIIYHERKHNWSTSELRKRIFDIEYDLRIASEDA